MYPTNEPGLLELAASLMRMGELPLDRIRSPCDWCTAELQCWHHKQFHPQVGEVKCP